MVYTAPYVKGDCTLKDWIQKKKSYNQAKRPALKTRIAIGIHLMFAMKFHLETFKSIGVLSLSDIILRCGPGDDMLKVYITNFTYAD